MASERNSNFGLSFSDETPNLNSGSSDFREPVANATSGNIGAAPSMPAGTSFLDEVMRAKTNRTLTAEGTEFVKNLEGMLKAKNIVCDILPRTNCYLYHNDKYAVGIMFEEHMPAVQNLKPRTRYIQEAYKEAVERFKQYPVADIIICSKTDYDRVIQYDRYIDRVLKYGVDGADSFNIRNVADTNMFRVNCSKYAVDQLVNEMSVHGVLPHYTYGFVLEMCTDPKYRPNRFDDYRNQDDNNWVPIMVVPAYTDFVRKDVYNWNSASTKFIPRIHISEPMCLLPNMKMLPLIMSLAVQNFLVSGLWKEQFNMYDESSANIGNLWFDPETNMPARVNDKREREQFIGMYCEYPTIVLDVVHGRASIPGLSLLSVPEEQKLFLNQFAQFFGDPSFNNFNRVVATPFIEYTGVVSIEGKTLDTRTFDYFKVIKACNNQRELLDKFVTLPVTPEDKLAALANMNYSVQSLYDTAMCVLEPDVLTKMAQAVGSCFNLLNQTSTGEFVDYSALDFASRGLRDGVASYNGSFFNYGRNTRNGYNPFAMNNTFNTVWNR